MILNLIPFLIWSMISTASNACQQSREDNTDYNATLMANRFMALLDIPDFSVNLSIPHVPGRYMISVGIPSYTNNETTYELGFNACITQKNSNGTEIEYRPKRFKFDTYEEKDLYLTENGYCFLSRKVSEDFYSYSARIDKAFQQLAKKRPYSIEELVQNGDKILVYPMEKESAWGTYSPNWKHPKYIYIAPTRYILPDSFKAYVSSLVLNKNLLSNVSVDSLFTKEGLEIGLSHTHREESSYCEDESWCYQYFILPNQTIQTILDTWEEPYMGTIKPIDTKKYFDTTAPHNFNLFFWDYVDFMDTKIGQFQPLRISYLEFLSLKHKTSEPYDVIVGERILKILRVRIGPGMYQLIPQSKSRFVAEKRKRKEY